MSEVDGIDEFRPPSQGLPFMPPDDNESEDDDADVVVVDDVAPSRRAPKPRATRKARAAEPEPEPKQQSLEDLDDLDAERELPKPVENIKTLGELYAKYEIGARPDFKAILTRSSPKFWQTVKIDGRYGIFDAPITEDFIQNTYGGGTYRVSIEGPHPTKGIGFTKHYESVQVNLPGDPILTHLSPRTEQQQAGVPAPAAVPHNESPKVVEVALGAMGKMLENERQDRREAERHADAGVAGMQPFMGQIAAAHDARANAAEKSAQERVTAEKAAYERLLENEREERKEDRRRFEVSLDEMKKDLHMQQQQPQVSIGTELAAVLSAMPKQEPVVRDDSAARFADSAMKDIQARHGEELTRLHSQHNATLDSMRASHAQEKQVIHDGQQRELQAERDAGRRREERIEDSLKMEREERRRDQESHRKEIEALDGRWKERLDNADRAAKERLDAAERAWKERIDQQKQMLDTTFDSRYQSAQTNWENRIQFLQAELDRAKQDVADLRARGYEQSDPIALIQKHKQLQEAMGVPESGGGGSGGAPGGIGLSGDSGDMWKTQLIDGLVERVPQILGTVENIFTKANAPPQHQQQPVHGQVVVENGVQYVILSTPQGWQKVPKANLDAHNAALAARHEAEQSRRGLTAGNGGGGGGRRYVPRQRKPSQIPIPDLSHGLEKPPQPGGDEDARVEELTRIASERSTGVKIPPPEKARRSQPSPQQQQQQAQQQAQVEPSDGGAMRMSAQEKGALLMIAKLIHNAVSSGEEPEEFIASLSQHFPGAAIKALVTNYTADQIEKGIQALEPRSAGATPAGQAFVHRAFGLLREQHAG
jgi:hypothetical protein